MTRMTPWVHQYSLRDLLDDGFDLFKERATTLLLAGGIPYLLVVGYLVVMRLWVMPGVMPTVYTVEALEEAVKSVSFWVFLGGSSLVTSIATAISYIVQCRVAARHALGQEVSALSVYKLLAKPFWSLVPLSIIHSLATGVISGLVTGIISLLCIVLLGLSMLMGPVVASVIGVIVYVLLIGVSLFTMLAVSTFFLAAPITLAMDHAGPFTALGTSFRYACTNYKAQLLALTAVVHIPLLVLSLVALVIGALVYAAKFIAPSTIALFSLMMPAVSGIIYMAIMACFQTLVYLDGRCRADAYDLVLMAGELGIGNEVEQALKPDIAPTAPTGYPNYMAAPVTPKAAADSLTMPGATHPVISMQFPDYSSPPPIDPQTPVTPDEGTGHVELEVTDAR